MESKTDEIKNPTAWIVTAAKKAGADFSSGSPEVDKKVRKTIGWYNNQGNLVEKISYPDVAPLLMQLDTNQVGSIFKSMESKTSEIRNPTAWIANAAKKFLAR